MNVDIQEELLFQIKSHLEFIYGSEQQDIEALALRLIETMGLDAHVRRPRVHANLWDERDVIMITYGDSIQCEGQTSLDILYQFSMEKLQGVVNGIHILPFFPYSSDDGFSVIDYSLINDALGDWDDIEQMSAHFNVMADLVINHCSSRSRWFENFRQCKEPGRHYFIEADPDGDYSDVVRPRTSPLLREVETLEGKKYVWCTFSHDQVDLNFANPEVLLEFVNIIHLYMQRGVKIFRLDAVAFLWKQLGTPCINLPQTHEVIRMLRTLIEHRDPNAIIITETNLPNIENLSYFGNANEAHAIYNFSLPPLVLFALVTGNCLPLKTWMMSMPPAQEGTFYFNFLASHDGIGLRPAEGLLDENQIDELINIVQQTGARVSWRSANGRNKPYEINVALYDAMQNTSKGPDSHQLRRFVCAHAIMLALEGIPGIYIHSFFGTPNFYKGVELTNQNRTINRYKWNYEELNEALADERKHHGRVFEEISRLARIRSKQVAFHPNATQYTLHLGEEIFGFWRQSIRRDQSIFAIFNVTGQELSVPFTSINLITMNTWTDLISGETYSNMHKELTLKPYQAVWLTNKVM